MGNLKESYPKDLVTIKLKKDIDEAIIKHYQPHTEIDIKLSDFPSKTSRFIEGFSVTAQYGSFFLMIPYLILLVMESSQLLRQKEKRLRIGLNIVGVTHFQFYFAELLTYAFSVFIISLHFCIAGYLLDFKFWSHGLVWYNMLILFSNGLIIGLLAFIVTACVSDRNLGMSVIYGFVLYSIVMQWLFTGGIILELLYLDSANNIVRFLKYLFNLYPSFHFSKIFSDVNRKADNHLDTYENRFVEGTEFTFNDLFTQASKHYDKPFPHGYVLPSAFESSLYLLATCLLYMLILAILDRTIESNRGTSQLWSIRRRKRKNSEYENSSE